MFFHLSPPEYAGDRPSGNRIPPLLELFSKTLGGQVNQVFYVFFLEKYCILSRVLATLFFKRQTFYDMTVKYGTGE